MGIIENPKNSIPTEYSVKFGVLFIYSFHYSRIPDSNVYFFHYYIITKHQSLFLHVYSDKLLIF